jgi:hypothetical protein
MVHNHKIYGTIGVFISLFWLAACSSPPPTIPPTADLNPIRTEAAATVLAQVTQELALTPSATLIPSPTATKAPTATPTIKPSPVVTVTATLSTGTPATATAALDKAQWVSQTIADNTTFKPGETFTMTWTLKNVGTSTWNTAYALRFFSGVAFGAKSGNKINEVPLTGDVRPGDTVDITVIMQAPLIPGTYRSDWVMSNASRANFKEPIFLQIKVSKPATPTPTPKP